MYTCKPCGYNTNRSNDMARHNNSKRHIIQENIYKNFMLDQSNSKSPNSKQNIIVYDGSNNNCAENIILDNQEHIINNIHDQPVNIEQNQPKKPNKNSKQKKNYICACLKEFNHNQNFWKHKKICGAYQKSCQTMTAKNTHKHSLDTVVETIANLVVSKLQSEQIKPYISTHNINNINTDSSVNGNTITNNVTNNKIVNVHTYISDNFTKAEPVQMLKHIQITKMLTLDNTCGHSIEELLIFHYNKYLLDQFIGDIITTGYKKINPEEQQFWSSDVVRLTFVVRQLLNENKVWLQDKKGSYLTKCVVTPILEKIRKILIKYDAKCHEEIANVNTKLEHLEKLSNDRTTILKIIYDINTKALHTKVLSYIAPRFQLESSQQIEKIEKIEEIE